jgi:tetratricopeptide (TPR) repeat protein
VARRGARELGGPPPGTASLEWRKAVERDRGRPLHDEPDEWVDAGPVRDEASAAVGRAATAPMGKTGPTSKTGSGRKRGYQLPADVADDVGRHAGPAWAGRVADRLADAVAAYEAERYRDARRLLSQLVERAPGSIPVRELYGLTLYRLGRWRDAIRELGAVETLTGSVDHHPVIADCHRALGQTDRVRELWDELRRAGASVDVVIEGRIVLAGALADKRQLTDAIAVLEQGPVDVRKPKEHHLRLWYALADLYERAGNPIRARSLFQRIVVADPSFADAADRLDSLGG